MRRLSILGLGLPEQLTTCGDDLSRPGDHIGHLKAHAGSGGLPLTTCTDIDDPSLYDLVF